MLCNSSKLFSVLCRSSTSNPRFAFKRFHNEAASAVESTLRVWFESLHAFHIVVYIFCFSQFFCSSLHRSLLVLILFRTLLSDVLNFFHSIFLSQFTYSDFPFQLPPPLTDSLPLQSFFYHSMFIALHMFILCHCLMSKKSFVFLLVRSISIRTLFTTA